TIFRMWWLVLVAVVLAGCGRIGFGLDVRDASDGNLALDDVANIDATPLGPFGTPVLVDLGGQAEDPTLTADLLELYFSSSRAGGSGSEDLWFVTRASSSTAWSAPMPVPGLN